MWLEQLLDWVRRGVPCAMVTIVDTEGSTPLGPGAKMIVSDQKVIAGTIGGGPVEHHATDAAAKVIREGRCRTIRYVLDDDRWSAKADETVVIGECGGSLLLLIEPIVPEKEIIIFGAGHVGEALAKLCDVMGQPYRVYDDRPEFASAERFKGAMERVVAPWDHVAEKISLFAHSYCVIMTYGHRHDGTVLAQLLENPVVPYIGMMGSLHKVEARFEALRAEGIDIDERVYSPIGLGIGQNNPGGIALSILSEIQLLMHGGTLRHLRIPPAEV